YKRPLMSLSPSPVMFATNDMTTVWKFRHFSNCKKAGDTAQYLAMELVSNAISASTVRNSYLALIYVLNNKKSGHEEE
ncbi:MAG: hypothetical protein ACSHXL_07675, partial [Bacteroidota bacterium]